MHHSVSATPLQSETDSEIFDNTVNLVPDATQTCQIVRSSYLVERLFKTPENNLFNYVKFQLVNDHIKALGLHTPRLMDIGCGLQVAKRFLSALNPGIRYFGIDYESTFVPDAVVDLNEPGALETPMDWSPNVVMLLDVLEHLHEDSDDLSEVVKHVAVTMPEDAQVIITVPQLYRLDRLKLPHLHYPEHKIRLTQAEWRAIIEKHFDILDVQGVGYLSVLPYLPMFSRHYKADNRLGRLFSHLRSHTFEKSWLKPADLFLSRTLGKIPLFKTLSNDILFVAKPRKSSRISN
ncbi:hypothetical protein IMCC3135_03670 [Granulosicoccus antarcticus IMCC3135]|uniref:Uncharacterized protein n=2 Tax=Granulosicoccus TaxID=437504 RepID=A0A2Z2NTB6_9GAMM|nr:hypothetical protein IMCC3135_03670 [Granulosicoccus antarcticus IMCC3135]